MSVLKDVNDDILDDLVNGSVCVCVCVCARAFCYEVPTFLSGTVPTDLLKEPNVTSFLSF